MLPQIIKWFKSFRKSTVQAQAFDTPVTVVANDGSNKTKIYLNDPSTPELMVEEEVATQTFLPILALDDQGGGFALGSIQQQASACKSVVNNALLFMASKSPKPITKWAAVNTLTIVPRAGKDINAFYDRGALKFFFFGDQVMQKNIFACDCRAVVAHEFGHAFLDILRPDFWNTQSAEVWAFHEAFGDITATLAILQLDNLIQTAINETGGDLMKSNVITKMAAEMGIGLYHLTHGEHGELPYCMRDLTIPYAYLEPEKLPNHGPDNTLINEPHSFSRILSGTFFEIIVKIAKSNGDISVGSVKNAADIAAHYFLTATANIPLTNRLFEALCRQIILVDGKEGGKYQNILKQVFSDRNLLRSSVMMLENVDIQQVIDKIKEPHEVQTYGNNKVVRTLSTSTIKLVDKLELFALDDNPLFSLEIEVPNQTAYHFENDKLTAIYETNEKEIINDAENCLHLLHTQNLVGDHESALFYEDSGKLLRKQIICTCNRPNYCDKNAPEYGKPWKPANNAGCIACHSNNCKPQSCDCNPVAPATPPKLGCYTKVRSGTARSYKSGQFTSRKVC